jgi:hypothetical protein
MARDHDGIELHARNLLRLAGQELTQEKAR